MISNIELTRRDFVIVLISGGIFFLTLGTGFGIGGNGRGFATAASILSTNLEFANKILENNPVIDGHNDFPWAVRNLFQNNISKFNFNSNLSALKEFQNYDMDHTDLPRMRAGKLGGQFWSAYIGCDSQFKDALQLFLEQIDVIKRLIVAYPDDLTYVETSDQLIKSIQERKIGSMIGVESGHAISSSIPVLRLFHELGVRYMTLTHGCDTPWAESSNSEDVNFPRDQLKGLSYPFGESIVYEMNRLGIMVDLAHVSSQTMSDVLDVSIAPVIFSHSSSRAVYNNARNVPDDILLKLKENGGIIMVNFFSDYVMGENSTVQDLVKHIDHIRKVMNSVDHIGIGSDFNGVNDPVLKGVQEYPLLFEALLDSNEYKWTEEELAKIANKNIIRVFHEVEVVSKLLRKDEPSQEIISQYDKNSLGCISKDNFLVNSVPAQ